MKRSLINRSHALTSALALSCFGLLGNQSEAATLLDFDFNSDTVGNVPSGWAGEQAADLSVALDASDWFGQGTGNKIARYTDLTSGDNGVGYTAFTPDDGNDFFTITFDYYMPFLDAADKGVTTALGIDDLAGDNERNAKIGAPDLLLIDSLVTVSMLVNESGSTKTFFNPLTSTTVDLLDHTFISFQYENGVYTVKDSGGPPSGIDLLYAGVDRFGFKTANAGIRDFYFDDVVLHDNELFVSPVPEPTSGALLGLGGVFLLLNRRTQR